MEIFAQPEPPIQLDPIVNEPVIAENAIEEQQTLKRSARISVKGITKNYSPKKTCKKKQPQPAGPFDSEEFQAAILMSLQADILAQDPLNQARFDEVDQICGIQHDLLTTGAGPSNEGIGVEDYGESVLADLEYNSEDDRLSDDESEPEGGGQ
jgi:hypothetical protein